MGEKIFDEHRGGGGGEGNLSTPIAFQLVNVLRPNLAQRWNFVYSIQKLKN